MVDNFFWFVHSDGRHLLWFISVCGLTNSLRVTWANELWPNGNPLPEPCGFTDWTTWLGREEYFHNVEVTFCVPLTLISTPSSKSVAVNTGFTSLPSRRCACLLEMTLTVKIVHKLWIKVNLRESSAVEVKHVGAHATWHIRLLPIIPGSLGCLCISLFCTWMFLQCPWSALPNGGSRPRAIYLRPVN